MKIQIYLQTALLLSATVAMAAPYRPSGQDTIIQKVTNRAVAPRSSEKDSIEFKLARANLLQRRHRFDQALAVLDEILTSEPEHVEALLIKSAVLRVLGRHKEGLAACKKLTDNAHPLVTQGCLSSIQYLTGEDVEAVVALRKVLNSSRVDRSLKSWALGLLGEIQFTRGNSKEAERYLKLALLANPTDTYLVTVLSDLMIQEQRHKEAKELLIKHDDELGNLIRLAIVEKASMSPEQNSYQQRAEQALQKLRKRGSVGHEREEALYALKVLEDIPRALKYAERNWKVQKEPIDYKLLAEAAATLGQTEKIPTVSYAN